MWARDYKMKGNESKQLSRRERPNPWFAPTVPFDLICSCDQVGTPKYFREADGRFVFAAQDAPPRHILGGRATACKVGFARRSKLAR